MIEFGTTFPSYFTRSTDVVTVNAVENSQARTYVMEVIHSTPDNGDITYKTVTINVGWCEITHISTPAIPSTSASSYIVFDVEKTITLTPNFEQVPACGYTLSENIVWTIPSTSPITTTADPYVVTVVSTDGLNHHDVNTVIVKNTVLYEDQVFEPSITFDITITDPCRTSTITAITLTSMTVVLGEEEFQDFVEAVDSAGTSYGATVCGTRLYEIYDISTNTITEVATVIDNGSGNYQIRAHSNDEDNEGSHNLRLKVTFVNYPLADSVTFPTATTNFFLTVNQAVCDCSLITWDNPDILSLETGLMADPADTLLFVKATANEASKDASPAIRACYRNNGTCSTSATIVVVDDDTGVLDTSFMAFASNTLTVTPTVSAQI